MDLDLQTPPFSEKLRAVLLFGPPGSGKGTQGKFLAQVGGHVHLSSGEIFRGLDSQSPAGALFQQYANAGHLVPDEVTIQIWHHYVSGLIAANRYFPQKQLLLLDGIPRTLRQAEILDAYLQVERVIVLSVNDQEELERRLLRRGALEKRVDDKDVEVLRTRMSVYQNETRQLLAHYPPEVISYFKAEQRPIEVLRDILVSLSSLF